MGGAWQAVGIAGDSAPRREGTLLRGVENGKVSGSMGGAWQTAGIAGDSAPRPGGRFAEGVSDG